MERIFVSPNYHRIHHRLDGPQDVNLGFTLTIWDQVFQRAVFPTEATIRTDTGLPGRPLVVEQAGDRPRHLATMLGQLWAPFRPVRDDRDLSAGSNPDPNANSNTGSNAGSIGSHRGARGGLMVTTAEKTSAPPRRSRVRAVLATLLSTRTAPLPTDIALHRGAHCARLDLHLPRRPATLRLVRWHRPRPGPRPTSRTSRTFTRGCSSRSSAASSSSAGAS